MSGYPNLSENFRITNTDFHFSQEVNICCTVISVLYTFLSFTVSILVLTKEKCLVYLYSGFVDYTFPC